MIGGVSFKLIRDRGFIGEALIHGFLDVGLTFYVRMKAGKNVLIEGRKRSLSKLHQLDVTATLHDEPLPSRAFQ